MSSSRGIFVYKLALISFEIALLVSTHRLPLASGAAGPDQAPISGATIAPSPKPVSTPPQALLPMDSMPIEEIPPPLQQPATPAKPPDAARSQPKQSANQSNQQPKTPRPVSSRQTAANSSSATATGSSSKGALYYLNSARQHWRHMDRSIGDSMSLYAKGIRKTLDEALASSSPQSDKVSKRCRSALIELVESLEEHNLWASQMFDASARLPAGLLEGTLTELGNFDQCLSVVGRTTGDPALINPSKSAAQVYGQYCSVVVKPALTPRPRLHTVCRRLPALSANTSSGVMKLLSLNSHQFHYVGLRLGLCVPSKCSQADLQQLLATFLSKYDLIGQVKSCQNRVPSQQQQQLSLASQIEATWLGSILGIDNTLVESFDTTQKCIIFTFVVLLALTLIGTIVDLAGSQQEQCARSDRDVSSEGKSSAVARSGQAYCKLCKAVIETTSGLGLINRQTVAGADSSSCAKLNPVQCSGQRPARLVDNKVFCASCLEQQVATATSGGDANAIKPGRRYWHYQVCPSSSNASNTTNDGRSDHHLDRHQHHQLKTDPVTTSGRNEQQQQQLYDDHCLLYSGKGNNCAAVHSGTNQNNDYRLSQLSFGGPLIGLQVNPLAQLAGSSGGGSCYSSDESFLHDSKLLDWTTSAKDRRLVHDIDHQAVLGESLATAARVRQQSAGEHDKRTNKRGLRAFVLCFSLRVNLRVICKLGTGSRSSGSGRADGSQDGANGAAMNDDIKCIHGLRTLAMVWIIFGHTIGLVSPEMMNNLFPLARLSCQSRLLQALLNATLAVDTFFMISGLVTAISFARKCTSVLDLVIKSASTQSQLDLSRTAETRAANGFQGYGNENASDSAAAARRHRLHLLKSNHLIAARAQTGSATEVTDSTSLSSTSSCNESRTTSSSSTASPSSAMSELQSASSSLPFDIGQNNSKQTGKGKHRRTGDPISGAVPSSLHWTQIVRPPTSVRGSNKCMLRVSLTDKQQPGDTGSAWPRDFRPLLWLLMRYLRLTPAYAAIIGLTILMPALGSGPFWAESVGPLADQCRNNWWLNLLYVNNFFETDKLCLIHSWYLSNDCQMFMVATVLLAVFYKSKRVALLLAVVICFASSAMTFAVTVANELPPTIVTTSPAVAERWLFIYSLYYKPWPHMTSYIIGLITGYLIVRNQVSGSNNDNKSTSRSSAVRRNICWFMFTLLALALLNSIYPWNMGLQVDPIITGLHSATFRSLWALCNAWLVWALVTSPKAKSNLQAKSRSSLGSLLSWTGFQMTSRLTYCAYLVHPLIIYYHFGTLRERMDSSIYGQTHRFLATLLMSYLGALLLSALVESPVIQLQRLIMSPAAKSGARNSKKGASAKDHSRWTSEDQTRAAAYQHGRHRRRQWPIVLNQDGKGQATKGAPPFLLVTEPNDGPMELLAATRNQQIPESGAEQTRKVSSSSSTSANSARHLLSISGPEMAFDAPQQAIHFCPHLTDKRLSAPVPVPIPPVMARPPVVMDQRATDSSGQQQNGNAPDQSLNSVAVDEQFQRKLAQAISRGFKIRSKLASANYTTTSGHQMLSIKLKNKLARRMDRDMRDHANAGTGTGTGHQQQQQQHHHHRHHNHLHLHHEGRCPDATALAESTPSNQQLPLPMTLASAAGEVAKANVNDNSSPLRPTRANRAELSTFMAHCNVTNKTNRTGDSDSKKVN